MEIAIFLGIVVGTLILAQILGIINEKKFEARLTDFYKKNYGKAPTKRYDGDQMEHVPGYFEAHKIESSIDDITWNDLELDDIFQRINYCNSASGEEYLYHLLRNPDGDEKQLKQMEEQIAYIDSNEGVRLRLQIFFSKIGKSSKYSIYEYLKFLEKLGKRSNIIHFLLLAFLIVSIIEMFFAFETGIIFLVCVIVFNIVTYFKDKNETDPYLKTFAYIMRLVSYADKFDFLQGTPFDEEIKTLNEDAKAMKPFLRGSSILMSPTRSQATGNPSDLIMDYIRIITHIDLIKFNQMYAEVSKNIDTIDRLNTVLGKIEAVISVSCFRASLNNGYCTPEFTDEKYFDITEGYHPLIEKPVANSFETSKGLLLTGSNASGKSTFLKTCAINAILAQSIHTCTAKAYKASNFSIYSSMALRDDLGGQDSYYIVEIKSLKRILDAAENSKRPILCFIDEVLRGTNTVERIAASTQILKQFSFMNVLCFAATHDVELNDMLKDFYDIYHFAGQVTDNDVHFDYLLHEGPATNRNAIKLLDIIGYDKKITEEAEKMAQNFINTGVWHN